VVSRIALCPRQHKRRHLALARDTVALVLALEASLGQFTRRQSADALSKASTHTPRDARRRTHTRAFKCFVIINSPVRAPECRFWSALPAPTNMLNLLSSAIFFAALAVSTRFFLSQLWRKYARKKLSMCDRTGLLQDAVES